MTLGSSLPSSPVLVGRILGGRYRLTVPLGGGASAAVFAAEDIVLRRQVAVKVLRRHLADDEDFLRRFQAEAQMAAALRHPNVLLVHDWGNDDTPFLVTELLEGGSLKDLIDRGFRATPSQALQLGLEACRGLDHAHRRGLVHRDIKPANLLFDDEAHLRVADFGLARVITGAADTEPLGAVLGTARYASPEQVEGRPLDGRSDVYSLALVLVEVITGELPFAAETSAATLLARLERSLEPPAAVGPLAQALAAAGRTDREERVDAAGLGRLLKTAALRLDRPDPLPLVAFRAGAPVAGTGVSFDSSSLVDPTAPLPPFDAGQPGTGGDDWAAGEPAAPEAEPEAGPASSRRKGLLAVLLVVILVVAGLAAGGAVIQPWRPTVDVPVVVGLSREAAAARLRAAKLDLREGGRLRSESAEVGSVVASQPSRQRQGRAVTVTLSDGPEPRTLPAVAARPAEQIKLDLMGQGLNVVENPVDSDSVAVGTALSIDPPAGSRVPRGATVTVSVSAGPAARPVPDVLGKTYDDAVAAFASTGLRTTRLDAFDDRVASGRVVATNPAAGAAVRPGLAVAVVVSKGPDVVSVPALTGKTPAAAQQTLTAAGLSVSATYGPPAGQVFSSKPAAGAKVKRGASVAIYTG